MSARAEALRGSPLIMPSSPISAPSCHRQNITGFRRENLDLTGRDQHGEAAVIAFLENEVAGPIDSRFDMLAKIVVNRFADADGGVLSSFSEKSCRSRRRSFARWS